MAKRYVVPDDTPNFILKRDLSGGMNTRQYMQIIEDNQAVLLQNILLETSGQTTLRNGISQVDSSFPPPYGHP
jgi:hypothetical protein